MVGVFNMYYRVQLLVLFVLAWCVCVLECVHACVCVCLCVCVCAFVLACVSSSSVVVG